MIFSRLIEFTWVDGHEEGSLDEFENMYGMNILKYIH